MISIYTNGVWNDISDMVVNGSLVVEKRKDNAFATGIVKLEMSKQMNIAPYTPFDIEGMLFVGCSKSNKFMTYSNVYFHDVELIEASALLSCFTLGSKSFSTTGSNKIDSNKLNILEDLLRYKYNVNVSTENMSSIFDAQREYSFGAGTTFYDAYKTIADTYLYKVVLERNNNDFTPNKFKINFKSKTTTTQFPIASSRMLSNEYSQNAENYCKYLETEANNVIDRTDTTLLRGLTCRAKDVMLNQDTAILETPTKIESIVDFGLEGARITLATGLTEEELNALGFYIIGSYTYNQIVASFPDIETVNTDYCIPMGYDISVCNNYKFRKEMNLIYMYVDEILPLRFSMMTRILEKAQWDILDEQDKPGYAFYSTGSNIIDNLHAYYKNDLWNILIGQSRTPFLEQWAVNDYSRVEGRVGSLYVVISVVLNSYNILDLNYYVEYNAITNPKLIDEKTYSPRSESVLKGFTRTYNNATNFVDYDKIRSDMQDSNNQLGVETLSFDYDCTGLETLPDIDNYIISPIDLYQWYIQSIQFEFKNNQTIAHINCTATQNSIADAIGVDSQFNVTKNPLNNIIERPIYSELTLTEELDEDTNYYLQFTFFDRYLNKIEVEDDGTSYNKLMKRITKLSANEVLAYCECNDFYTLDTFVASDTMSDNNKLIVNCPYVDNNNEIMTVEISLYKYNGIMSLETSSLLPLRSNGSEWECISNTKIEYVFKDAREKLTFTVKLKEAQ